MHESTRGSHCPDVCIEFVCQIQIWHLGSSLENLLFDRSNRRLSFQSLRNCFVICQRIVGLVACSSIFVAPALLLRYPLLGPFATLLDLLCHHSLSQFLHPSRCCAQSHLSQLSFAANDQRELPSMGSSAVASCPDVVVVLACAGDLSFLGPSSRWPWWLTRPDCSIHQHLCTTLECVPRQSLYFSMVTRLECVSQLWT